MKFNAQNFNTGHWNGLAITQEPPLGMVVLFNTTKIYLDWPTIAGATDYQVQVSLFPDFRSTIVSATVVGSNHTFTDTGANDAKRYWRWRPSKDGGLTFFEPFSEVGSYWLNTGAAQEIICHRNTWKVADPDTTTDVYVFPLFPLYTVIDQNLFRIRERNRLGELLTEYLDNKVQVSLMFQGSQYLNHQHRNELIRFNNIVRTVFLATHKDGERGRPMPHIWKMEFFEDPALTMIAAGRPDFLSGQVNFQEV